MTADVTAADALLTEAVTPTGRRFVLHWGEMGSRWGVNRTVSQIHALLFFLGRPMHAGEIAEVLQAARANVSNSLRELQNWDLVRVVVRERKEREFDPTVAMLRECVAEPGFAKQDPATQKRLRETLALVEALSAWAEEMLGLETTTLKKVVKLLA